MGRLLTASAAMQCAHAVPVAATPAQASTRVFVLGQPVLLARGPITVAGCPNLPTPAQPGNTPCTTLTFVPVAQRVVIESAQPLLQEDETALDCSPPAHPVVTPVNHRVEAT